MECPWGFKCTFDNSGNQLYERPFNYGGNAEYIPTIANGIGATGDGARTQCTAGYYCPYGTMKRYPCPAGHYCPANSALPTACSAGYFNTLIE